MPGIVWLRKKTVIVVGDYIFLWRNVIYVTTSEIFSCLPLATATIFCPSYFILIIWTDVFSWMPWGSEDATKVQQGLGKGCCLAVVFALQSLV